MKDKNRNNAEAKARKIFNNQASNKEAAHKKSPHKKAANKEAQKIGSVQVSNKEVGKSPSRKGPSRQVAKKPRQQSRTNKAAKRLAQKSKHPKKQGRLSSFSKSQKALVVLAIVGVFFYFIYQPACLWYGAVRDNQVYQEQLTRYHQSNGEMQDRKDYLNTDEGAKEEAYNHGYAEQGESTATVEGLPEESSKTDESPIPKEITQAVIDEPDPFYVQILDFLFLYHKGQ